MRGVLCIVIAAEMGASGCDAVFGVPAPTADASLRADALDGSLADDAAADAADAAIDAIPDAPPLVTCPAEYIFMRGSSRFRFVSALTNWLDAATDCANDLTSATLHTHLVVIGSEEERSFVQALRAFDEPWIGLSDRRGSMQWVTNENVLVPPGGTSPWGSGQPSNNLEDCVHMQTADYYDDACTSVRSYFCECDAFANDPNNY